MNFSSDDMEALATRQRANLINCITGFKPALLLGTVNTGGHTNLAMFNNVFHIGASPPLLGLIVRPRPEGTERHSLDNLLETEHYTLNHVHHDMLPAAHQTSARYPREQSEFAASGLSALYQPGFPAPFVAEARIRMGLRLVEHQELSVNHTQLVIGELEVLNCPDDILRDDGSVDLAAAGSVASCGLDSYHSVAEGQRYAYAKANLAPRRLGG